MKQLLSALVIAIVATTAVVPVVRAQDRTLGEKVDDATITAGVKAAMVREPTLKVFEIDVETVKGVVQLSGFVSSADSVAAAASVARTVKGVKSVRNDLRLK